ncbi:MAG TPA: (Fe-S)-binding protein [Dissulfurispiraceae bacterium]|nr:(Fe-S)-binding protein [Dissulfurispiraceae bacterium]
MLLNGYRKEIFRPACNNSFESLHCIAHLEDDISEALPYVNAVLGGDTFIKEPPSVTFKLYGKLITVHGRKIAVNALRDEAEADHILDWFKEQINEAWEKRADIVPKYDGRKVPHIMEIYKMLPKSNCKKCGQPTCMMFASIATQGVKKSADCPELTEEGKQRLESYLSGFRFD